MKDSSLPVLLPWDSEFFGFPIARLPVDKMTPAIAKAAIEWARTERVRCIYFRAASGDPATLATAQEYGFRMVDVRMEFKHSLKSTPDRLESPQGITIREGDINDLDVLEEIAAHSYSDSRFYCDSGFPPQKSSELYRIWLRRSLSGEIADFTLVGVLNDSPIGYVTATIDSQGDGLIGLVGISHSARGKGAGYELVMQSLVQFKQRGATSVIVPTQARNVVAQRLYQRCGFLTDQVFIWFHLWLDK